MKRIAVVVACAAATTGYAVHAQTQPAQPQPEMTFFVTSTGSGKGADFGGLAGADRHCQSLATAAGAGGKTWHAYLSTTAKDGQPAVNARDRIGTGPWHNAKGSLIAKDVAELHGLNGINIDTALTEKGEPVNGRGSNPLKHDILTGSQPDGTAYPPGGKDMTCANWTSSDAGSARLGHHDRRGIAPDPTALSWNSAHDSAGCSDPALAKTGGAGLLYCFAVR